MAGQNEGIRFENRKGTAQLRLPVVITLVAALLTGCVAAAFAGSPALTSARTESSVEALALEWFAQMRAGQIDRTQLTAGYSAQLTDDVVQATSRYLKEYEYGASPTGAQVLKTRTIGEQTFYVVKIVFPRGDAASLLLGFNAEGKITGISLMSMAGD
ncbi:MAG: hypothetical protein WB586_24185 [Chthoniobacterales bacterium]